MTKTLVEFFFFFSKNQINPEKDEQLKDNKTKIFDKVKIYIYILKLKGWMVKKKLTFVWEWRSEAK